MTLLTRSYSRAKAKLAFGIISALQAFRSSTWRAISSLRNPGRSNPFFAHRFAAAFLAICQRFLALSLGRSDKFRD